MNKIIILISLIFISCGKSPLLTTIENGAVKGSQSQEVSLQFKATSQDMTLKWLTQINTNEEGKLLIILSKNGVVTDPDKYELKAFLWMKSMGHGSSPIAVKKLAPGIYQLDEIYFSMAGDWQLHLTLNSGNTTIEDQELQLFLAE